MCFFFQAEDGIRDLVRSRGLGDVYKRQELGRQHHNAEYAWAKFTAGTSDLGPLYARVARALSLIHI